MMRYIGIKTNDAGQFFPANLILAGNLAAGTGENAIELLISQQHKRHQPKATTKPG